MKREPEELGPLAVKLEAEAPPRRGVIDPEDYLPPGQEEHLERVVMERSAREREEGEVRRLHELEYEQMFPRRVLRRCRSASMKVEQAKFFIDLDPSDEDLAPPAPPSCRRRRSPVLGSPR